MNEEGLILETKQSWWNYFWYLLFAWLIVPFIIALIKRASIIFRVYEERVVLERGILSKNIKEVFIEDIRTIDIKQKFLQRIIKVGDLMIATSGTSGYEKVIIGFPKPKEIKNLILEQRRKRTEKENGE